ncbi:hypothetical protein IJ674_09930 [bacterium]|nr:hypothetical protein [bacterium]
MILIKRLEKPFTDAQRCNFIVEENHNKGYEIKETDNAIESWGMDEDEIANLQKNNCIEDILKELNDLDLKSIRAIRSNDEEYIEKYENRAIELRKELQELQGAKNDITI